MVGVTVRIAKNGPYLIKERVELIDATTGERIEVDKFPVALCRCGKSQSKPFCDGAHSKIDFYGTCSPQ